MRILLYLERPDLEIVLVEPAPKFGSARGRAVFGVDELDSVLGHGPSASEFRAIVATKIAFDGLVVHDAVSGVYDEDDELYL